MATRQPLPRQSHAAVGIGSKMVIWGGHGGSTKIKTTALEIFDVSSVSWEEPQVLHGCAVPDELCGMAFTTDGETSYSFKGTPYNQTLLQITPSQHLCQRVLPTSSYHTMPESTSGSCLVQFQDKLILHGGNRGRTTELHVFDLTKSECEL